MARLLFEEQSIRTRRGRLARGVDFVVYTDAAGTVLADISATSGGSSIASSTVTTADIDGLGPAAFRFYGPDEVDTLYLRCPDDLSLGVQEIEADTDERLDALEGGGGGGGGAHPDLATHDALGLATDAELTTHAAAADPHGGYVLESGHTLAAHDTLGLATDAELTTHAGAANPHTVYALNTDLATHAADTTAIHGITDASVLATDAEVASAVSGHAGATDPHGDRAYADSVAQGLEIKASVRLASTADLTLSGEQTIDGVLTSADRVLVKNQAAPAANGIYVSAAGAWARATDADIAAEVGPGVFVFVEEGTVNGGTGWAQTTPNPITLGTTALVFSQFSSGGTIIGGDGLAKTGNTLDVVAGTGITVDAATVGIAPGGVTNTQVNAAAAIAESKLALNFPTHAENHAARHAAAGADPLTGYVLDSAHTLAAHDTLGLVTDAILSTHEADTTAIHGITDTAQVAVKNATNTFTADQYLKAGPFFDVRPYIIARGSAPGVTSNNDRGGINDAIVAANAAGGGTVILPPVSGVTDGYLVNRSQSGVQSSGAIVLLPKVNLLGWNTKLYLTGNTHFIKCQGTVSGTGYTITADTTVSTTTLSVTGGTTGLVVGQDLIIRLGDTSDPVEPDYWTFAKVVTVGATTVTIDRPIGYAMSVGGTTPQRRSIWVVTTMMDGNRIQGLQLINDYVNLPAFGGNAEAGIDIRYAQNIHVEDVVGLHCGAGLILTQYVDSLKVVNAKAPKAYSQSGSVSKGRVFSFAETRNVEVTNAWVADFQRQVSVLEFGCENIHFQGLHIDNTFAGRSNTSIALFNHNHNCSGTYEHVFVGGNASYVFDAVASTGAAIRLRDIAFRHEAMPMVNTASMKRLGGDVFVNGVQYSDLRRFSRAFSLTASTTNTITLPSGLLRSARVYVSSATGITSAKFGNGTSDNGNSFHTLLVAAQTVDASLNQAGLGSPYTVNDLAPTTLKIVTDGTLPAGTWGSVEVEMFTPLTGDDVSLAHVGAPALLPGPLDHDGTTAGFYGVAPVVRATVAAAASDPATTQTLVNDLRAKLVALGLVQ